MCSGTRWAGCRIPCLSATAGAGVGPGWTNFSAGIRDFGGERPGSGHCRGWPRPPGSPLPSRSSTWTEPPRAAAPISPARLMSLTSTWCTILATTTLADGAREPHALFGHAPPPHVAHLRHVDLARRNSVPREATSFPGWLIFPTLFRHEFGHRVSQSLVRSTPRIPRIRCLVFSLNSILMPALHHAAFGIEGCSDFGAANNSASPGNSTGTALMTTW